MGFCYPGKGSSGENPPRPEYAQTWHSNVLERLTDLRLTLLIGQYAQHHYLKDRAEKKLTDTVRNFESYLPEYQVLPHPSPRNNIWKAKNPWFEERVIPILKQHVSKILS